MNKAPYEVESVINDLASELYGVYSSHETSDEGGEAMTNLPPQPRTNLSEYRIAAYECGIDGSAVKKGKRAVGWYGMFDEDRLKLEILPKLAEYVDSGLSYPFLVTSYMLEGTTDVQIEKSNVKFRPRRRRTIHQNRAVVYSKAEYRLI